MLKYPFRARPPAEWWPRPSSADLLGKAAIFDLAVIGARRSGHEDIADLLEKGAMNLREMSATLAGMERRK